MEGRPAKRDGRKPTLNRALGGKCVRTDFSMVGHGGMIAGGGVIVKRCIVESGPFYVILLSLESTCYLEMSETLCVSNFTSSLFKNRSLSREILESCCMRCLSM